jgi:SAM-dependent methyltransferase
MTNIEIDTQKMFFNKNTKKYNETENARYQTHIKTPIFIDLLGNIENKKILDIGCGFGRDIKTIINLGYNCKITGLDISKQQIKLCKENIKSDNVTFLIKNWSNSDSTNNMDQYDIAYESFVCSYTKIENIVQYFKNTYKILKKGGKYIIMYNNYRLANNIPKVYDILKVLPTKVLNQNYKYENGSLLEIYITDKCVVQAYHYDNEFIMDLLKKVGFDEIKNIDIKKKNKMLELFTDEEIEILIKSKILNFFIATKK